MGHPARDQRECRRLGAELIQVDGETDRHAWGSTLKLAERHRLMLYDAVYLELALRRGLPLASLDEELRSAARDEKVQLLGI